MFFPRLRRHARWMFVLLALVFGLGFVLFGIGAGGTGIGDLLRGGGSSSGGDTPSVEKARERVERNPKDAQAQRDLATALQLDGRTSESITALERYTELKPKDADALRELAGLYLSEVNREQQRAQAAQERATAATGAALFTQQLELGQNQTLGTDPITEAVQNDTNRIVSEALGEAQQDAANALDAYQRLAASDPADAGIQLELAQTAQSLGETATAIAAYQRFLKLAPDDPSASLVRQQIKQLRRSAQPSSG